MALLKLTTFTKLLIYYEKTYLIAAILLLSMKSFSQGSPDYGAGMKFNLNEDGSKYTRFIAWNQIWFRSSQMNQEL
jgi:hypothetical protein